VTDPVGLTRAEEERERQVGGPPRSVVVAPPGAPHCQAPVEGGGACRAVPTVRVTWADGQKNVMCRDCADRAQKMTGAAVVGVERIG
jgi:hypothetical protein